MFICSLKPKALFKKLLLVAVIVAAVIGLFLFLRLPHQGAAPLEVSEEHNTQAPNNLSRIAFLQSYGWEVSQEPCETVEVVIPEEFGDVYENYNAIQLAQGFDLRDYRGKQVRRYTYEVLNYPQQKEYIRANLLLYRGEIIGGDICSIYAKNGFMHGFALPQQQL